MNSTAKHTTSLFPRNGAKRAGVICVLVTCALVSSVSGQPATTLPAPKDGQLPNLTPVVAPHARSVALGEVHGLLAFCHDRGYDDAHVSLVRLDAKGLPLPSVTWIKLPSVPALAKTPNYAVHAAFHPKHPLLYVWQDVPLHYTNPPQPQPPDLVNFNHLAIYSVAKDPPELMTMLCRGDDYLYGMHGGGVAVDRDGAFLYIPNLRDLKNAGIIRVGRFPLDADGFPDLGEATSKLPAAAKGKKLTELNTARPLVPPKMTPVEYVYIFPLNQWGAGHTIVPLSKDVVLSGGYNGVWSWRPDDPNCPLHGLQVKANGFMQMAVHPTLPGIYVAGFSGAEFFFHLEQTDGWLTSLPRKYTIPEARLQGVPAVLPKHNRLVLGEHYHVHVVNLDKDGRPTAEVTRVPVFNPAVRALAYSEKFDRLYAAIESSK